MVEYSKAIALAALSAFLFVWALTDPELPVLVPFLMFVPILTAILSCSILSAISGVLIFSLTLAATILFGTQNYGYEIYFASVVLVAALHSIPFLGLIALTRVRFLSGFLHLAMAFSLLYLCFEYLATRQNIVPLGSLASTVVSSIELARIVYILGPLWFSPVVLIVSSGIAYSISRRTISPIVGVMLAGAGLFLTIALSEPTNLTIQEDRRKTVSVAIIQGSITKDQYDMADASYSYVKDEIKRAYVQLTLMELNEVDLVVWPETALHDPIDEQDFSLLDRRLVESSSTLIAGHVIKELDNHGGVKHYNAASSFTAGMTPTSTYRKNNLLPITESKFTPGIKASALKTEFEKMAVLICFEAIYKSYVEQTIKKDVSMVVVLSNDSGFGRSLVSYYMLKQAMLIAVSQNKHVIRASQAGVSAFINPNGSITKNAHTLSESC